MTAGLPLASYLANPRVLVALVLMLGLVSSQGGKGTLAYFTATASSTANTFVAGKLALTNPTASGTSNAIQWNATGINSADCALETATGLTTANAATGQPMVPGTYCTGLITLTNTGTVDAWLRLRLHLDNVDSSGTAGTSGTPLTPVAATTALLSKMKFSLFEVSTGNTGNCATANFTSTHLNAGDGGAVPTGFTEVNSGTTNPIRGETIGTSLALTKAQAVVNSTSVTEAHHTDTFYNLIGDDTVSAIRAAGATAANLDRTGGTQPTRYFCAVFHFPNAGAPSNNTSDDNAAVAGDAQFKFTYAIAQKSGRG
jgi:predicted ribosomally synthesized peptide with SipW-like signal peptide